MHTQTLLLWIATLASICLMFFGANKMFDGKEKKHELVERQGAQIMITGISLSVVIALVQLVM